MNNNEEKVDKSVEEVELEVVDGTISVKNHEIVVSPPNEHGEFPTISPSSQVIIAIDGQPITKQTPVKDSKTITYKITEKRKPWFKAEISKDKVEVLLTITEEIHKGFQLRNSNPVRNWVPTIEEAVIKYDVEELSSTIIDHIYKMGIKAEIKAQLIIEELSEPSHEPIVIAKGKAPTDSKDGYIELFFSNDLESVSYDDKSAIDYRNRYNIPKVSKGDKMAQIHPPKKGKEGLNVFGVSLPPKPAKSVEVRPNRKVKLNEDGSVIALVSGRPSITGNVIKVFDIVDTYSINKDIDLETGNIYFNGDVVITGNVKEHMRVEAMGNILINGNVYFSTIISSQNIVVNGTVINSQVISGQHGLFFSEVYKVSEKLYRTIKQLYDSLKQMTKLLEQQGKEYKYGQLVATLVESKFKTLTVDIESYYKVLSEMETSNIEVPIQMKMIKKMLAVFRNHYLMLNVDGPVMIRSVRFALKELLSASEASIKQESDITIQDANMCTIKTNGSIFIEKAGVIHSTLFAGKDIIFTNHKGVIRGGKVEAMNEIHAGVVGSDLGSRPKVYAGQKITIKDLNKAVIKLNQKKMKVMGPIKDVTFSYNEKEDEIKSSPPVRVG
ncbi:DUF342 domain-containing protein [Bacillus sp. FJAT-45350]|uniref:DUF342 domain-containing protein n=1 Tax=Bacillus sp. FJAT-45350 TaxID=2011014 RepID=UPI0015C82E1D|nr:FapA family protein [Bacillus sp. FJAT-45350]